MLLCLAGISFKSWLKLVRKSKKAKVCLNVSETALSIKVELTEYPWVQSYYVEDPGTVSSSALVFLQFHCSLSDLDADVLRPPYQRT